MDDPNASVSDETPFVRPTTPNPLKRLWDFISSPNYRRTLGILTVLIIAAAVPLTVLMARQQTKTQSKAATTCQYKAPLNDAPTVTLLPDDHTAEVKYAYTFGTEDKDDDSEVSVPTIDLYISDKDQRGFAPSSQISGVQFGSYGISFDTNVDGEKNYYYQAQAQSAELSVYSNTSGVLTRKERSDACGDDPSEQSNVHLQEVRIVASTTSTISLQLTFDITALPRRSGGCDREGCPIDNVPAYLMFTNQETAQRSYVPWVSPTNIRCTDISNNRCWHTEYKAQYIIDLPPATSATYSITGYHAKGCPNVANIGTQSILVTTATGTAIAPLSPAITTSADRDKRDNPFVKIHWTPTQAGQTVTVYRNTKRWPDNNNIGGETTLGKRSVSTISTHDMQSTPTGTYYFGAKIESSDWCDEIYSDQTIFSWTKPPTPFSPTGAITPSISPSVIPSVSPSISPNVTLITGDMNRDNKLDIADYNIFLSCYGTKATSAACGSNKILSDFDDNDVIDGVDYNIFVRSLATREGD